NDLTLSRQQDYEYTGQFAELKESVRFDIRAEDYISRTRTVTVVPPPGLTSLTKQENRPAYLYYRTTNRDEAIAKALLKGKRQLFDEVPVTFVGVETSMIDIPIGSDLIVTAKTDKKLQQGSVRILPRKNAAPLGDYKLEQPDDQTFRAIFPSVRGTLD